MYSINFLCACINLVAVIIIACVILLYDYRVLIMSLSPSFSLVPKFSATNIKMTSVYTMLRLCSNHPYLLEFPLTPSGDFKVDEELVQCAGKIRVLDRLLTALIKDGHKVSTVQGGGGEGRGIVLPGYLILS